MAKVAVLGISADPPHEGHLGLSLQALDALGADEVWWLVTPCSPWKQEQGEPQTQTPFAHRMKLCELLTEPHYPRIKVRDFEAGIVGAGGSSHSRLVLSQLTETYKEHTFVFLMGSDHWCKFHEWTGYKTIMEMVSMAVFKRDGYRINTDTVAFVEFASRYVENPLDLFRSNVVSRTKQWCILETDVPELNSTDIRIELARNGTSEHLTEPMLAYIKQHNLYGINNLRLS